MVECTIARWFDQILTKRERETLIGQTDIGGVQNVKYAFGRVPNRIFLK